MIDTIRVHLASQLKKTSRLAIKPVGRFRSPLVNRNFGIPQLSLVSSYFTPYKSGDSPYQIFDGLIHRSLIAIVATGMCSSVKNALNTSPYKRI